MGTFSAVTVNWSMYLDSNNPFSFHEANMFNLLPHDGLSRHGNEVQTQSLGDEGEGAGDPDVALDHLQLVILEKRRAA